MLCGFGQRVRMDTARRPVRRAARRLFLGRSHFSAEKTRGARAQPVGMFLPTSKAAGAGRVLLVGAASSPRARVRPTPQETVATLKFSFKKLVVAHPRLEQDFPLFREPRKFKQTFLLAGRQRVACSRDDSSQAGLNVEILQ